MSTYTVIFENNRAVLSVKADMESVDPICIERANNRDEIKWMTIFADNEEASIEKANEIASRIMNLLHPSI